MYYLDMSACFQCSESPVLFTPQGISSVTVGGKYVLNNNTVLSIKTPGVPCAFLTVQSGGTPVPCPVALAKGVWKGFSENVCVGSSFFLTSDSQLTAFCPQNPIAVLTPLMFMSKFGDGASKVTAAPVGTVAFSESEAVCKTSSASVATVRKSPVKSETSGSVSSGKRNQPDTIDDVSKSANSGENRVPSSKGADSTCGMLCVGKNGKESCPEEFRENCPYREADYSSPNIKGTGSKLFIALRKQNEGEKCLSCGYKAYCDNRMELYRAILSGKWRKKYKERKRISIMTAYRINQKVIYIKPVFHHIIPTGSNICRDETLVRMVNFTDWDVNNARNGIALPMNDRGNITFDDICQIMKQTGSQFHNTKHDYYINSSALKQAQAKLPAGDRRLRCALRYNGECYTEVVNEQLGAIIDTLRDEFGGQCLMKIGRERVTQRFWELLGELDDEIRNKLEAFRENPLYSAPYFINEKTVAYSYKIDDIFLKTREEK